MALLLSTRRVNQVANWLLAVLLVLIAAQSVLVAFDTRAFFVANPHLSKISWLLPTLFGPLIYLFTDKLTRKRPRLRRRDTWFLLPFGACLLYLLPYYLQSAAKKVAYLDDFAHASQDDFSWLNQLINGEHLVFVLLALRVLHRHERRMRNCYSDLSRVRVRWLKQFLGFILVIMVFGIGAFYARKWGLGALTTLYDYHLHYLGAIALIYWIGYKALGQPALFGLPSSPAAQPLPTLPVAATPTGPPTIPATQPESIPAHEAPLKYQKSTLTPEQSALYQQKLLAYMEEAKPYRQNTLTLQELAQLVGLPKHRLSQLLNEQLGKSFYDFVNEYRVVEVKQLLRNPRFGHYTTLAIAEEAGFNSKATFNAVFKKITGLTPTEYTKQIETVV
ncbi:helix-turn-helix transcriptional regulator [Hymenobacter sp. ASUV-10]|uniref:Helix-turn-helix transcriptional regulator n=1 Tax=Hymenobacter aranciens TaxID=3063996 RepID=A0ABT9BCV6_9BACT|nr:helix-turn-helix transcriptional regulator [Hymenobacter sp. ASUV-10]MDO7874378.1 helix-turn-helix transcriptional regulator [Hymenobacter sp. ASUV-10]